jgi:acetyltransferase-like isoleucine patch superfamily enzyme
MNRFFQHWYQLTEVLSTVLVGGIPRKPGILLRRWLYRRNLNYMGQVVSIERDVDLFGTSQIEIGDNTFIDRNVCLKANHPNCRLVIGKSASLSDAVCIAGGHMNSTISIHDEVKLDRGVDIRAYENGVIEIGRATYIGSYSCLAGPNIKIGQDCLIASHVSIYANNRKFADSTRVIGEQGVTCSGVVIEDDCWLGTGVRVLDGVTIGQGSVIGAGSVVTRSIPPYSVAIGVPARVVSQRGQNSQSVIQSVKVHDLKDYDRYQVGESS